MTQQLEIKKYRRRVSDERVNYIATQTENHPATVRAVPEDAAEVIELKDIIFANGLVYLLHKDGKHGLAREEQFHGEWEERT